MSEDIIKTIHAAKYGQNICYLGPSLQQAKELIWQPICERLWQLGWDFTPVVSKSRIELRNNRKIYVLGAEKISRVRGHRFLKVYMDEVAFFTHPLKEIWRALRPTLSDYKGGAIVATTPNGRGTDAYEFYRSITEKESWKYFSWTTADNPFIDRDEIESAKRELDEKSFKQEYMATWETYEGLCYYNFDEDTHVSDCKTFALGVPVHIAFDFNVNPTTLLVSQMVNGVKFVRREYSFADSSTERTIKAFIQDYPSISSLPVKIRGDAAGNQRKSTTGKSDYEYVHAALNAAGIKFTHEVPAANPAIIDRVNAVNGWLKPMIGPSKIVVDPSCKELIKDLGGQKTEGRLPSPANNLGHKADALGYDIHWDHLMSKRQTGSQRNY